MATNTEKIVVQIQVKGQRSLDKLDDKTKDAAKSVGGLQKNLLKMAAGVAAAATAFRVVARVVGDAIKTFKNFEFQMAKVKATTGATDKDFKKLTASAQQLGRTTFFTATQVGELQMNFAKLGFSTSEILDAQEATLRLATATGSDLARAAIVAGAAVRGFGLDASETERVVDVMAVAFTSSALDIEKWQTSMTKVAPIAAGANVSIESTAAIMGKLTDAGIEASIAGTSMRNIFLKMQDSSSDLSKHLGFTVKSSDDLEKALKQLNSEGLSNEEMMGLVDLRQVAAFATMVNGTDVIIDMTDALEDANGSAQEMADIMADTLEGDLITAKSAWEGFQLSIMNGTSNISKWLREATQIWTFTLNKWSDSLRDVDAVSADIFTNTVKASKEVTERMNKDFGENTTTLSKELDSQNHSLEKSLNNKDLLVRQSELKIKNLTKDGLAQGRQGAIQSNAASIADEKKVLEERIKIFNATKLAIIDLTEEIKVQKKKESDAITNASIEESIQAERNKRDKAKGIKKDNAAKAKKAKEDLALGKKEFNDEKERIDREARELNNTMKQGLIDNGLTQETFDTMAFDAEQQRLKDQLDLYIKYGEDTSVINNKILSNELKMIADKAAAEATAAQKKIDDAEELRSSEEDKRESTIKGMDDMANQMIKVGEQEENLNELKRIGIQLSQAVAIVKGIELFQDKLAELQAYKTAAAKGAEAIATTSAAGADAVGAVSKAANNVFPYNLIAIAATIGALISVVANVKALSATFGDGGVVETFANGGMVHGKSHAQGGEKFAVGGRVVELEGGEAVINKRSTAMFSSQLSAMNSAGGGVKFADGGLLNQPSFSQQQFNALGQNQMMGAMGNSGKVTVVEADITSSQNTVSVIQSQATI
jgi:TP901 family phage tail tape measure protein